MDLTGLPGAMDALWKSKQEVALLLLLAFPQCAHSPLENAKAFSSAPWKTAFFPQGGKKPVSHRSTGSTMMMY